MIIRTEGMTEIHTSISQCSVCTAAPDNSLEKTDLQWKLTLKGLSTWSACTCI